MVEDNKNNKQKLSKRGKGRPPLEWMATDEVTGSLCSHLGAGDENELLAKLGVDFRHVIPRVAKTQSVPLHIRQKYGEGAELDATCYGVGVKYCENYSQFQMINR